jgi:hypothetical protein
MQIPEPVGLNITNEQKEVLSSVPSPTPERNALIGTHLAYAAVYLPRARRLLQLWGVEWPERFEAVTWKRLGKTLAIQPPYSPT